MMGMEKRVVKRVSLSSNMCSSVLTTPAIESRVARIKARVAELTGNMQQTGGRP